MSRLDSSAMLPGMGRKPRIAIVGAGNFGSALAVSLHQAGYAIETVVAHSRGASMKRAQKLAGEVGSAAALDCSAKMRAQVVWFTVPDVEIASAARNAGDKVNWKGKLALHSSGARTSDELDFLRRRGASVASVHPLMTFVRGSRAGLAGVPFAVEGDPKAVGVARRIVKDVGGDFYVIRKRDKAAYHAWGTFASPLFDALLATTEQVAAAAGVHQKEARRRVIPILLQTLANYAALGAPAAFSGPFVRGDVDTVKRHLRVLRRVPQAREVYIALAKAALRYLPSKKRKELAGLLER
jgi:predicted short-subunit dehydrogenase-like oxidoreductase (DUF2520 family)